MKNMSFWGRLAARLLVGMLLVSLLIQPAASVYAQDVRICFTLPDLDTHNVSGTVNSYWPGTNNAAAGAVSVTLGTRRGAAVDIQHGDLLLVIQMQGAQIDYGNDATYGSGSGSNGSGYLTSGLVAGIYEYVVADNDTPFSGGGSLAITGKNSGGLMNAYVNSNSNTTQGQFRFQVIRVPGYLNINVVGEVTAATWDGTSGGIIALEAVNILALGSQSLNVNSAGFRGGGGRQLEGTTYGTNTDYLTRSTRDANGSKGEGLAGTPRYVYYGGVLVDTAAPNDGYPSGSTSGGSYARGAPGNAGGGGTDGNPSANDENSGGGGGGNGGAGGLGGNSWSSNLPRGGRNGANFAQVSASRLVLGGGGGAGTTNNGTGTPINGLASSGGVGGGMVFIRTGGISGSGTISANGANTLDVLRDSTGGGGSGGSVLVITNATPLAGLTVNANGGNGGDAWPLESGTVFPGNRHGPGGGGGGGVVYTTSAPTAANVNGGLNGTTTAANDNYGATVGSPGLTGSATIGDIPGAEAGFECYQPTAVELVKFSATPGFQVNWLMAIGLGILLAGVAAAWYYRRARSLR